MRRLIAHYVPAETAALGLVELVVSFLIIEAFLNASGSLGVLSRLPAMPHASLGIAFALITAVISITTGLYRHETCLDRRHLIINAGIAGTVAFPVLLLLADGLGVAPLQTAAGWLLLLLALWLAGIVATHVAFAFLARHGRLRRRILVLGSETSTTRLLALLRARHLSWCEPVVAATIPALSPIDMRRQGLWGIVVADPAAAAQGDTTLLDNKLRGVRVLSATAFAERHLGRVEPDTASMGWLLAGDGFAQGRLNAALKRTMDIAVSLILLALTLPVIAITALLIRLDSPGPVLYRQQRIGLHGTIFTLLKFRSMRSDAEAAGDPCWAQRRDPRVTRVGRFIRQTRIDELPQIINVLRGEMSMIGPRPERPHFVEQLSQVIPLYRQRAFVKPGLTGWAQVNYPYGASVEDAREKLAYDLYYVKNRSMVLDLLILSATVRVILSRDGAR
jgi:exopolysaccharide biosynthesis polyprenyl glycosylphosphotransferase